MDPENDESWKRICLSNMVNLDVDVSFLGCNPTLGPSYPRHQTSSRLS